MFFDTHAHLEDKKFKDDLEEVIENIRKSDTSLVLNIGFNREHIIKSLKLSDKYDFIYSAVGLHPSDSLEGKEESFWEFLYKSAQHPKVQGIGEMGLDYYWDRAPRDFQKKVFIRQIDLAKELEKPIIIHDREAHGDILEIVKREKAGSNGGVFHAYSGSLEMAREVIKEGFHISVGGVVTFQNAKKLVEIVKEIPLEHLLIETDAPYLTPHPFRGKRNDPIKVKYVAEKIAEIKGISIEEVAAQTMKNGKELFRIEN